MNTRTEHLVIASNTSDRARRAFKKRKPARLNDGLCILCDARLQPADSSYCKACRKRRTEAEVRMRARHSNRGLCAKCGQEQPVPRKGWCATCCEEKREYRRAGTRREARRCRSREIRQEVIRRYGGRCECCEEIALEALVMDHRRRDRRQNGDVYRRLFKASERLPGFRVLCHVCSVTTRHASSFPPPCLGG